MGMHLCVTSAKYVPEGQFAADAGVVVGAGSVKAELSGTGVHGLAGIVYGPSVASIDPSRPNACAVHVTFPPVLPKRVTRFPYRYVTEPLNNVLSLGEVLVGVRIKVISGPVPGPIVKFKATVTNATSSCGSVVVAVNERVGSGQA